MQIYNNNPAFGDTGPFDAESFGALADEMESTFRTWAAEKWLEAPESETGASKYSFVERTVTLMRREFIAGLQRVDDTVIV
jgi:hypothetical protein